MYSFLSPVNKWELETAEKSEGHLSKNTAHNRHSNVFTSISGRIGPEDP